MNQEQETAMFDQSDPDSELDAEELRWEVPARMRVPWESFTVEQMNAAESALDWIFTQIAQYGVRTGTTHPDVMALIIAELNRASDNHARRAAEVIA